MEDYLAQFQAQLADMQQFDTNNPMVANHQIITRSYSTIHGNHNTIRASSVTVVGHDNHIESNYCNVRGHRNTVEGSSPTVDGDHNTIRGNYSNVRGHDNRITGSTPSVTGDRNTVNGKYSNVNGHDNVVDGNSASVTGHRNRVAGRYATAHGNDNILTGHHATAHGNNNQVPAAPQYNAAAGDPIQALLQQQATMMAALQVQQDAAMQALQLPAPRRTARATTMTLASNVMQVPTLEECQHDVWIDADDTTTPACVICREKVPLAAALPCLHMSYCLSCARVLCCDAATGQPKPLGAVNCAKCRQPCTAMRRVFVDR